MLGYVIALTIEGFVLGMLGRLFVPGRQPMGCLFTILCGLGGALIGGVIGRWIWGENYAPGLIMGVICTALLIWALYGTEKHRRRWVSPRR
jgi:uncharacterized membrane protein YeaQ/YmgE (transglycosylase-associated protein family)